MMRKGGRRGRLCQSLVDPGGAASAHARDRYVPSLVSTRIFSPSLMNGGTCTPTANRFYFVVYKP